MSHPPGVFQYNDGIHNFMSSAPVPGYFEALDWGACAGSFHPQEAWNDCYGLYSYPCWQEAAVFDKLEMMNETARLSVEDVPSFIPLPPGLGLTDDGDDDMQPALVDVSSMSLDLPLPPPGLCPPPGLENALCKVLAQEAASTPTSLSTAAESGTEDLQSPSSTSSDDGGANPAAVASAFPLALAEHVEISRELQVDRKDGGRMQVQWPVDSRKLQGKDRQIISSGFELFPAVVCKLMIKPKPQGLSKGLLSFQKARGCGSIELKIIDGIEKTPAFQFSLSIGSDDKKQGPRGPVEHDFASSSVCGLPRDEEDWDFRAAVDPTTHTFLVSLEVMLLDVF
jgi:hypothetical protein